MSTSIKNFIPAFNKILDFYGIKNGKKSAQGAIYALIFGRIWSYSQMKKKVCNASHSRIADDLHMSRLAVRNACARMVEDKFLTAVSVGPGRPLEYTTNLDVLIEINLEVEDTCKQRIQLSKPVNVVYSSGKRCIQQPVNNDNTIISTNDIENNAPKNGAGGSSNFTEQESKKKKEQSSKKDALDFQPGSLAFLPSTVRPLGAAFLEEAGAGYAPIQADIGLWRKVTNEWAARGFTPDVIKLAIREMRKAKLTISGPQSITKVGCSIKGGLAKDETKIYHAGDMDRELKELR